jgi:MFS family permease
MCAVAFMDLLDGTIVNVALPVIRTDLRFSVQSLQWVPSAYLLTYGGFLLLGGRLADLLGGACSSPGRRCSGSRRSCAVWPEAKGR